MKTEQINIRLDADLVSALERVAREESLDRATAIRRLLETSLREWELERALVGYRRGDVSLGRAAEEAGLTQWELVDATRAAGLAYPLDAEEARRRVEELSEHEREAPSTLRDIPPQPGGVLLVGINPAPISVAAEHYYQGPLGRRLWRRLEKVGLLRDGVPGAEDEAFARAGHGLTDLVKRPARSARELTEDELRGGVEALHTKIREWQPGLVLFAFKEPARRLIGPSVSPGSGPEIGAVPTFLLSGPYAPRAEAERVDAELGRVLASLSWSAAEAGELTQPVTANDLARGQIRLPRAAKRFFPGRKGTIEIVLRGARASAGYDPRTGPGRERSAVLRVGNALRDAVRAGERLRVTRGLGGTIVLE